MKINKETYEAPLAFGTAVSLRSCIAQSASLPDYDENNPGDDSWVID